MGRLEAIVKTRCPRCRKGKMFKNSSYDLGGFSKMYKTCEVCQVDFEPEPGFYVGAMYFSYGINTALMIGLGVVSYAIWGFDSLLKTMAIVLTPVILLVPLSFRLSRALMLHLFGGIRFNREL